MMKLFWLIVLFIEFVTLPATAAVNMRNGSYTEKWVDFIEPGSGYEMTIERFYSSRSLFIGLFGFGWCSNIETYLTITSDGIINLTECGGGLEVTYYPDSFDLATPENTANEILKRELKMKKMTKTMVSNLKAQLIANTRLRFEYANKHGFVDTQKLKTSKNTFLSTTKGFEKIDFDGKTYRRHRLDGYVEVYNKAGKLTQIFNPMDAWVKIQYKGQNINYLVDNQGRRLTFTYGKDGKLETIYNAKKLKATYQFSGENLASVNNMWSKSYGYNYDANHNLLGVRFPDNTRITLSYDIAKDWIKSYTNRKGCTETFDFQLGADDPQNHYWGQFSRKCKNETAKIGRHEFWYKKYPMSKQKYLHRVKETYDTEFKDMYLHPYLGKPISLRENLTYQGFAYLFNGLLNKQEYKLYTPTNQVKDWWKTDFNYTRGSSLVSSIQRSVLNSKGVVTEKIKRVYSYTRRGLLHKASSGKQFVKVSHGDSGKLDTLENHKKTKIKLSYQNGSSHPESIEQLNLGKIAINYDSDGSVESIKSVGKRNVSSSIVENFLEMVDFLGPLGEQLKL